jgi:hypothetical protein
MFMSTPDYDLSETVYAKQVFSKGTDPLRYYKSDTIWWVNSKVSVT